MAQSSGFAFRLVSAGFDTSRTRLLRLQNGKIGLLFQPGAFELSPASNPFPEGTSRPQTFHRILPVRASSAIDLIVNVNSQDSTQAFLWTNVPIIMHLAPPGRGTRIQKEGNSNDSSLKFKKVKF